MSEFGFEFEYNKEKSREYNMTEFILQTMRAYKVLKVKYGVKDNYTINKTHRMDIGIIAEDEEEKVITLHSVPRWVFMKLFHNNFFYQSVVNYVKMDGLEAYSKNNVYDKMVNKDKPHRAVYCYENKKEMEAAIKKQEEEHPKPKTLFIIEELDEDDVLII